jgi:hypothetical protein
MAALFYMGSVLCYIKARSSAGNGYIWFLMSAFCGVFAFLRKSHTASLPGAILLVEFLLFERSWSGWKKKLPKFAVVFSLWFVFVLLSYGFLRGKFEGGGLMESMSSMARPSENVGRWSYLCTQFNVLVIYIRMLFLPVGQSLNHLYSFNNGFFERYTPLAFLFLASIIMLGIRNRNKHPLVSFAVGWFFITLSVESSVFPISDAMYEHRLYLPMHGFAVFFCRMCYLFCWPGNAPGFLYWRQSLPFHCPRLHTRETKCGRTGRPCGPTCWKRIRLIAGR